MKESKLENKNNRFLLIIYIFLFLFISLTAYLCYFVTVKGEKFANNAYNPRINSLEKNVIRGDILASDGTVLAHTEYTEGKKQRVYPQGELFSHVVGYTDKGMSGLELNSNKTLLSSHDFIADKVKNDVSGVKNQGDKIITTLDPTLQKVCYDAITTEKGAAVAIDPETGAILAEVSKPSFNPNTIATDWSTVSSGTDSALINRAASGLYPPGSTFKIITALSYLRDGGSVDDTFDCESSYKEGGYTVHCAHNIRHGHQTLKQAFANSCNVSFSKIGLSLGNGILRKTAEEFGFNEKIDTDQNITKSRFLLGDKESKSAIMATSFGQGQTLVTPMQMCLVSATVANDGTMMKPYLIDKVKNSKGDTVKNTYSEELYNIMSSSEVSTMKDMMRSVCTSGTAKSVFSRVTKYDAYGKTGTAEFNSKGGTHSWFTGFATNGEKTIAIAVILEDTNLHAYTSAEKIFSAYFN